MKIIGVDSYERESVSDHLVCENVSESYGKVIVNLLNNHVCGETGDTFFKLVEDNHALYVFDPQ